MRMLVLLAALLATTATYAASNWRDVAKYEVWIEACFYTQYSCVGVSVPKVVYQKMRPGLLGRYAGGDTVYVNRTLSRLQTKATLHHEMIHYLQAVNGLKVPGPAKEICQAEAEAFALTDKRWVRMGMPNKQRGPNWWRVYSHCHKWFDPDWKPRLTRPWWR